MEEDTISSSVNLRDVGAKAGGIAKNRVFRSSQFYSQPLQHKHIRAVSSVLDLRREGVACKNSRVLPKFNVLWRWCPELFRHAKTDSHSPTSCAKCECRLNQTSAGDAEAKVFHVDLVTLGFKRRVFQAVPLSVKLKAIGRLATFRSPETVLAEKVADPDALGYKKLYVLFLEQSKKKIAAVFTVLEQAKSYPVLIHCVHGKDRTGMVVMLLLLLCHVDQDAIVAEYMISASCMRSWRQHGNDALDAHLQTPMVLSVEREYIYAAMEHIHSNYSGIEEYLESCSVSRSRQAAVKKLLQTECMQV